MEALKIQNTEGQGRSVVNIDTQSLVEKGYLVASNDRSAFNEQYRQIKRVVIDKAFGKGDKPQAKDGSNLVMVTSPKEGEGKTFVSINLALSSALEKDKTVLLIDVNVVNPSVSKEFDFESPKGLIDFLLGDVEELSEVIHHTSIPRLKIIPAGNQHYLTNELLASDKMKTLFHELSTRYPERLVIFDSPAMNTITDTAILASEMGQMLLVVENNKTSMASAKKAKEMTPSNVEIGVVVNKKIN